MEKVGCFPLILAFFISLCHSYIHLVHTIIHMATLKEKTAFMSMIVISLLNTLLTSVKLVSC